MKFRRQVFEEVQVVNHEQQVIAEVEEKLQGAYSSGDWTLPQLAQDGAITGVDAIHSHFAEEILKSRIASGLATNMVTEEDVRAAFTSETLFVKRLDQDIRSQIVVARVVSAAHKGKLNDDHFTSLKLIQPSERLRTELASDSLSDYVSQLYDGNSNTKLTARLAKVHALIDVEGANAQSSEVPNPLRRAIRRAADLVRDLDTNTTISSHSITELHRISTGARRLTHNSMPKDLTTLDDLLLTLQNRVKRATKYGDDRMARQIGDIHQAIDTLKDSSSTGRPARTPKKADSVTSTELGGGRHVIAQRTGSSGNRSRKLVAATVLAGTGVGIVGTGAGAVAAAATPERATRSSVDSDSMRLASAQQDLTANLQSIPITLNMPNSAATAQALQPATVETIPNAPVTTETTATALPNADPNQQNVSTPITDAIPIVLNMGDSETYTQPTTVSATETTSTTAATSPNTLTSAATAVETPVAVSMPATAPAQTPVTTTAQAAPINIAVQTEASPIMTAPVTAPEMISPQTNANMYQALLTNGASVENLVEQLSSTVEQSGAIATPYMNYQAYVLKTAQKIEAYAETKNLSASQMEAYRNALANAVVFAKYPTYMASVSMSSMLTTDTDYLNTITANFYANPTTMGMDDTTQAEMNSYSPVTVSAINQLFSSAEADIMTPQERITEIGQYDPALAATLTDALAKTKIAVGGVTKVVTPTKPQATHTTGHATKTKNTTTHSGEKPHQTSKPAVHKSHETAQNYENAAIQKMAEHGTMWETRAFLLNYFLKQNFSPAQAAGIVGNILVESGGNPERVQAGYGADAKNLPINQIADKAGYGYSQWTSKGRQQALIAFAKKRGTNSGDAMTQLDFIMHEVNNSYTNVLDKMHGASSPEQAASIWMGPGGSGGYENPNPSSLFESTRQHYARQVYNMYMKMQTASKPKPHTPAHSSHPAPAVTTPQSSELSKPVSGSHVEYVLHAPANGHSVYYINQVSDLNGVDGINGYDACGLTSTIALNMSLKNTTDPGIISKIHQDLLRSGEYSDSEGITDHGQGLISYIQNNLGLNTHTILQEKSGQPTTDGVMSQVRAALDQNKQGKPTLLLIHTSNKVSEIMGGATSGHFLLMYGYDNNGYYVANVGNRADSPPQGHAFSRAEIESWIDGFTAVSLPS